jgi:hypothetical protein
MKHAHFVDIAVETVQSISMYETVPKIIEWKTSGEDENVRSAS